MQGERRFTRILQVCQATAQGKKRALLHLKIHFVKIFLNTPIVDAEKAEYTTIYRGKIFSKHKTKKWILINLWF